MQIIVGVIIGILITLIGNYLSPPFNRFVHKSFSKLFHLLNPDRFDLTGTWEQTFKEPTPSELKEYREVKEKIELDHVGNVVVGKGKTTIDPREFKYQCTVSHNLLFGSYKKIGEKGNISGSGLIQLIINPDRLIMKGQATWYDQDTGKIESSDSLWQKMS